MSGPLSGLRIIEIAGIGPAPFCAMMLADHGAQIIRVDRIGADDGEDASRHFWNRSRRSIAVDLKNAEGIALVRKLAAGADGIIEGFRPGVMERLGLGPDVLLASNPKLVYGRMTGWGQDGPYAGMAGHDINYIALSGALHAIGREGQKPVPPLNLVGDMGGGGLMLAFGMLAALYQVRAGGNGQVVDCAMTEGSAALMVMMYSLMAQGQWRDERAANLLDSACHFYDSYETSDGKFIAIGSIEPQFYRLMLQRIGLGDDPDFADQNRQSAWPRLKEKLTAHFLTRTRDEWCAILEGTDACFAPVLSLREAMDHPHNKARGAFVPVDGDLQPAPVPRFVDTPSDAPSPMRKGAAVTGAVLAEAGIDAETIARLRAQAVVA